MFSTLEKKSSKEYTPLCEYFSIPFLDEYLPLCKFAKGKQIREDLKVQVVLENVVGVVALSNTHEVILGLEVKMGAVNG